MIGKCKSSGGGLAKYLLEKRKGEEVKIIEKNNIFSETPQDINKEFEIQARTSTSRKKVNKYIQHMIFSHHKKDNEKGLLQEKEILNDLKTDLKKRKIDLENTQYYIVRHQDKNHLHYHLAFNKVSNNGTSIPMHNASVKCKNASIKISRKYELECGRKTEQKRDISEQIKKDQSQTKEIKYNNYKEYEESLKRERKENEKNNSKNQQNRKDKDRGKGF